MAEENQNHTALNPEDRAIGGYLSSAGRKAAIRTALPLVGRYFRKSGESQLESSPMLGRDDDSNESDSRLIAALRFRAALSLADKLYQLIETISLRPTFRYELVSTQSTDLTGSLDIGKWSERLPVFDGEISYPILEVRRAALTPENIMATYASLWILNELELSQREAEPPSTSPEVYVAQEIEERFRSMLARPVLTECLGEATFWLQRGEPEQLLKSVESRLRRREISNSEPYQELFDLVVQYREDGPETAHGSELWSFYDEEFDTTLFEIWCLHSLASSVSDYLATEIPTAVDSWTSGLAYRWSRPSGVLSLYGQRSLANIDEYSLEPRWREAKGNDLRGIPDITAIADPYGSGAKRLAIIDAKLRQRSRAPTEELYKILGYFNNFGLETSPTGAVLYYSPTASEPQIYRYENSALGGTLLAVELNPANLEQSRKSMQYVAEMLLEMLQIAEVAREPILGSRWDEEAAVRRNLTEMKLLAAQIAPQNIDASRRRINAMLGDECWNALNEETQTMLATSDHIGFLLDADADFSGPVLGLCASLEVIIHTHVLEPALAATPENRALRRVRTFGSLLHILETSLTDQSSEAQSAIYDVIRHGDLESLAAELPLLWRMNSEFRIPAAHKERLTDDKWQAAFQLIIGETKLLNRLITSLPVTASSSDRA